MNFPTVKHTVTQQFASGVEKFGCVFLPEFSDFIYPNLNYKTGKLKQARNWYYIQSYDLLTNLQIELVPSVS